MFRKLKYYIKNIISNLLSEDSIESDFYRNYSKYGKIYKKKPY